MPDSETASSQPRIDLTPLIADDSLDIVEYVLGFVQRFEEEVRSKLQNRLS